MSAVSKEPTGIKLNYDDVNIVPSVVTYVTHRLECNPYTSDFGTLPIIASGMSCVVSKENADLFRQQDMLYVLPRNISFQERVRILTSTNVSLGFVAFSLDETEALFLENNGEKDKIAHKISSYHWNPETNEPSQFEVMKVCIDIANGHMDRLIKLIKDIKDKFGNKVMIMSGNIANPETYKYYDKAGCDYVRLSIGTGNGCCTSSNVGVHYNIFSLLKETYEVKKAINGKCKLVADGGIKEYRDIQKALLFADYVMVGSMLNKALESAGKTTYGKSYFYWRGVRVLRPLKTLLTFGRVVPKRRYDKIKQDIRDGKLEVWKEYYGMSTKKAQLEINTANGRPYAPLKTGEGCVKRQKVEYTLAGWAENEADFLRSAMSYTNSYTLEDYKNSQWIQGTQITYNK